MKILIRLALKIFCRKIAINDALVLQCEGPMLLACNHPDSFLDAIIIGSMFSKPVHFLARGDAFRKPFARKMLAQLRMIPIYRLSEGREYLALNDTTFDRCREILLDDGIVLIFSEGLCQHQYLLRQLKKGTARIAIDSWSQAPIKENFRVLPVSINYNSFTRFGKRMIIHFGGSITSKNFEQDLSEGEKINQFNKLLSDRLKKGMIESNGDEHTVQFLISNHASFDRSSSKMIPYLKNKQFLAGQDWSLSFIQKLRSPFLITKNASGFFFRAFGIILIFIPAIFGWILHAPLYYPIKNFVKKKTSGTVFFDSVMFGILLIAYPLYWLIINAFIVSVIHHRYINILFLLMPVLAWATLICRDWLQEASNYFMLSLPERKKLKLIFG